MRSITRLICLTALAVTASSAVVAAAPSYTQTFTLRPGWNSVYLEVEPAARATADVFQGIPVASVWAWEPRRSTVDFIQNPSDGLFNRPGWLGYFPAGRPEAILTNLFIVQANRAYLIKLEGSSPVVWTVTGRPALDAASWVPNSFNLVGLPVDPAVPPTFGQYFASSPAHDGQPIYRLGSGGVWEPVTMPFATSIRSGEAYWVFCSGASEYAGPVDVSLPAGDGLDFGQEVTEYAMLIRSGALAASAVSLRLLPSAAPVPLSYAQALSQGGVTWPSMPPTLSVPVLPGEDVTVQLAVVRASMTGALAESVLEITNGLGARRLVPVSALQFGAEVAPSLQLGTVAAAIGPGPALRGMWVGTVTVNAVSEAQSAILDPDPTATPTRSEFNFRILLHVGLDNKTRLLKEVTQMFRPGTDTTPSGFVLVTDDSQISKFKGASLRDGDPVGYRITSAVYDFPSGLPDNAVVMSGIFGPGGSPLEATIELLPDAKTNPFRHAFHPDHDNLDAQYEALPSTDQEVYTIRRRLRLAFDPITPEKLAANPGYGTKVLEGSYQEIFGEVGLLEDADGNVVTDPNTGLPIEVNVGGLHRNVIKVQGTFRLTRLTLTAELNK